MAKMARTARIKAAVALVALLGVWGAGSANAQPASAGAAAGGKAGASAPSASASQGSLSAADRNFLMQAAASGLVELEAARLAADKAKDEAVKRYAAMLVEQHTAANQELMELAQSKGLTLPTTAPASKRRDLNRLNRASADDFDATFVQMVGMREHRQDVRLFRDASRNAKDPEVKAWAAKMLPTLEKHMKEAQALPAAKVPMDSSSQTYGKGF